MHSQIRNAALFVGGITTGGLVSYLYLKKQQESRVIPYYPPPAPVTPPSALATPQNAGSTVSPPVKDYYKEVKQSATPLPPPNMTAPSSVFSYGSPGPVSDIIVREAYALAYDRHHKNPAWVRERQCFTLY
jgi:hypothetical protein